MCGLSKTYWQKNTHKPQAPTGSFPTPGMTIILMPNGLSEK